MIQYLYKLSRPIKRVDFLSLSIDNRGMSPFLDSETRFDEFQAAKYVTVKNRIYYSDAKDEGMGVAREKHSTLAIHAGATEILNDKPVVDDAGAIDFQGNRFSFFGSSSTCHVKNETVGKKITYSIAIELLGKDRVT